MQVLPVYERLQQCLLVVVKQQQVGGQAEVAAQCLPLTRTCNYNTHTSVNTQCNRIVTGTLLGDPLTHQLSGRRCGVQVVEEEGGGSEERQDTGFKTTIQLPPRGHLR